MGTGVIAGVLITLYGVANCFFGYLYSRLLLAIWGLALGASLGLSLTVQAAPLTVLLAGIVGAILGPVLVYFFFPIGVFVLGAGTGFLLASALFTALGYGANALGAGLVGAIAFGVLALLLRRIVIIILTALLGASTIVIGVTLLLDSERILAAFNERQFDLVIVDAPPLVGVFWLLLAVSGFVVQSRAAGTQ
jgi:hypothetical protein